MTQETGSDDDDDDDNDEEEEEEEERQPVHHASMTPSQQQALKHIPSPQPKPEPDVNTRHPSIATNSPRRESASINYSTSSQVNYCLN
jgi:hypothetical protein